MPGMHALGSPKLPFFPDFSSEALSLWRAWGCSQSTIITQKPLAGNKMPTNQTVGWHLWIYEGGSSWGWLECGLWALTSAPRTSRSQGGVGMARAISKLAAGQICHFLEFPVPVSTESPHWTPIRSLRSLGFNLVHISLVISAMENHLL